MSAHARIRRGVRAGAQVSLGLSIAALTLALGAGAAVATPVTPASPDATSTSEDGPLGTSSVTGLVWEDVNHDGLQEVGSTAEHGVANVPVIAFFEGADASKLPDVAKLARARSLALPANFRATLTDADGKYTIEGLPAAKVRVLVAPNVTKDGVKPLAEQYRFTKVNAGTDDTIDSDFTQKLENVTHQFYFGEVAKVTLAAEKSVTLDAGIIDPKVAADNGILCINAFNDADRDGLRDKGEAPIAGLLVGYDKQTKAPAQHKLMLQRNGITAKATAKREKEDLPLTDKKGRYCFDGLERGRYIAYIALGPIEFKDGAPVGITKVWELTKKDVGTDESIDSDFALLNDPSQPEVTGKAGVTDSFRVADDKTRTVDAGLFKDEPSPAPSPSPSPGTDPLPTTGAAVGGYLAAGGLLLAGGIALTVLARRRRRTVA